jgi:FlaA1/EpsC-like NDP-sugar epimerase
LRLLLDLGALSAALAFAYGLRFDWKLEAPYATQAFLAWPLVVALQYALLNFCRVPKFAWSHFSLPEVLHTTRAFGLAMLVLLGVRLIGGQMTASVEWAHVLAIPASVIVIDAMLATLGLTSLRALRRLQVDSFRQKANGRPKSKTTQALVVGAGRAGRRLVEELQQSPNLGLRPVAFIDDMPALHERIIHGVPVRGGIADLARIARETDASTVLIAITSINRRALRRIMDVCASAQLQTKIVPPLHDLIAGQVGITQVRDVAIEDLLGREPVAFTASSATRMLESKTVLVTGAGGSIGSELCRQIQRAGAAKLVLVERAENNLYNIHRELVVGPKGVELVPAMADVSDASRMRALFEQHRPEVVFHAAAHKHVPMMEENPAEAIKNNLFGTKQVADLADEFDAEDFVLVSTDKAVNPTSVMGASKRLAELYVQDLQKRSAMRLVAVRFGNVLGSSGSVIPLFREQIQNGGPVTVTHPEMTRYFMTIAEACRLVIEAGALKQKGAVMMLDMGEPVKIVELARQMIRLSGFDPDVDVPIEFTGVRPGEKLFEELSLDTERCDATRSEKIFVWRSEVVSATSMQQILMRLASLEPLPPAQVRGAILGVLPEFQPQGLEVESGRPARNGTPQASKLRVAREALRINGLQAPRAAPA